MNRNDVKADTQLIYIVEGEPYKGTLSDWAKAMEHAHYAGLDVPSVVWVADLNAKGDGSYVFSELRPVNYGESHGNDFSSYYYRLGEQDATVRIDDRA